MKVKELIEILQKANPEDNVELAYAYKSSYYDGDETERVNEDICKITADSFSNGTIYLKDSTFDETDGYFCDNRILFELGE